jgi:phosphopentomutase
MKKELALKWAITLESGNYKQGYGRLRDKQNNCCCIGVLADIVDPTGWEHQSPVTGDWKHCDNYHALSKKLRNKIGMSVMEETNLINMNDGCWGSFTDIAAAIRKEYGLPRK